LFNLPVPLVLCKRSEETNESVSEACSFYSTLANRYSAANDARKVLRTTFFFLAGVLAIGFLLQDMRYHPSASAFAPVASIMVLVVVGVSRLGRLEMVIALWFPTLVQPQSEGFRRDVIDAKVAISLLIPPIS
jgi:hypothetical protein